MNIVVTKKKKRHIYAELTEHLFTISCDYPLKSLYMSRLWAVGDISKLFVWPMSSVEKSIYYKEIENKSI